LRPHVAYTYTATFQGANSGARSKAAYARGAARARRKPQLAYRQKAATER